MGWTFTPGQTRAGLIKERTKGWESNGTVARCLKHTVRGNVLWTVWEIKKQDKEPERFIGCDLLRNGGYGHGWGYKDMCESMGPGYYTCPLSYLDMVPVADSPYAEEWREKVREYHTEQKRRRNMTFEIGQRVDLVEGTKPPYVFITRLKPLVGKYDGIEYRIPRQMIA